MSRGGGLHGEVLTFVRIVDGVEVEITEVDYFGNTPEHGQLRRVFVYNGPMWAVWAHYFPETEVVK